MGGLEGFGPPPPWTVDADRERAGGGCWGLATETSWERLLAMFAMDLTPLTRADLDRSKVVMWMDTEGG